MTKKVSKYVSTHNSEAFKQQIHPQGAPFSGFKKSHDAGGGVCSFECEVESVNEFEETEIPSACPRMSFYLQLGEYSNYVVRT
jgi:hypothetical protein